MHPFPVFPPWVKNEPSAIFDADYKLFFWCFITTFFGYEDMLLATRHQLFQKGTMEVRVLPLQISFPVTISHHNQIKTPLILLTASTPLSNDRCLSISYVFVFNQPIVEANRQKTVLPYSLYYLCMTGKKCQVVLNITKIKKLYSGLYE